MKADQYSFIIKLSLIILFVLGITLTVKADETSEQKTGILVEDAHVTVSDTSSTADLEFSVTNMGSHDVTLIGLASDMTEEIEIYFFENGERVVITDLAILQEETLDLASSHLKVVLVGMKQKLQPGSKFEFTLNFRDFETTAVAHVHG